MINQTNSVPKKQILETIIKPSRSHWFLFLTILSLIANFILSIELVKSSKELSGSDKVLEERDKQIYELLNENTNLLFPSPTPTISFEDGSKIEVDEIGISFVCPVEWECEHVEKSYTVSIIDTTRSGFFTSFIVQRLDSKTLNNPNYNSVISWYDGLLHKQKEAIGANLDKLYGAIGVPGTDAVILPIYRGYDLDSIRPLIFNNNPGLYVNSPGKGISEFLIPNNTYVYRFSLGNMNDIQADFVGTFLTSIEFY